MVKLKKNQRKKNIKTMMMIKSMRKKYQNRLKNDKSILNHKSNSLKLHFL